MKLTDETILNLLRKKSNHPMKVSELVRHLGIPDPQRRVFRNRIKEMAQEGTLIRLRGGRYGLPDEMNLVSGILTGHPNGYGFVRPDKPEEGEKDLYIPRSHMGTAMHQDRVIARVEGRSGRDRPEGRVIRILQRNTASMVGVFETFGRNGWVVPMEEKYSHDIFVPAKAIGGAKSGQVVTVKIEAYPTHHQPPQGKVTEILGYSDDPEVEIKSVFRKFGVSAEFPDKVMNEADRVERAFAGEEDPDRRDLTGWLTFTIDGEKAKDFDDAVSLETLKDGWRLGVHIADVSHFVREESQLDKEAFRRGTSIYYPDGVIPMLPFQLSNEVCSLKPNEPRLTMTALIDFDRDGAVLSAKMFNSRIQSRIRFTYNEVARLLKEGDKKNRYAEAMPVLIQMHTLSRILRSRRFKKGSMDMNIPEAEILVNKEGKVEGIRIAEHNEAHELIEEFMLAANQAVARYLTEKNVPLIHRIHEKPDEDKIADFNQFIASFGFRLRSTKNVRSTDLQNLLKKAKGHKEERTLNTLLLRTMKKAIYSEGTPGHFALGFSDYTHFTSPIRRYPDLVTHRMLKQFLKKRKCSQREKKRLLPKTAEQAAQSSVTERRAMEIEREINDLRRAQFMVDKIGQTYSGFIIGVTAFGFFVELKEVFVEGLVRISSLTDDYYIYIEPEHKLRGQRRHKTFTIGDTVTVRVADVDIANRRIQLAWVPPG